MYPDWAKERRQAMREWVEKAWEKYQALDEDMKDFLKEKYLELIGKSSKGRAQAVSETMAELLQVPEPFKTFTYQWKWNGFFGMSFVEAETWNKIAKKAG